MGNFNEIVPRRINIYPARKATLVEAQTAPIPFDKYYSIKPTRPIKKLDTYFILPAYTVAHTVPNYIGQFIFQYNVTAPAPFFILNPVVFDNSLTCILTIKWRVGTTVYRYFLMGNQIFDAFGLRLNVQDFPLYANQEIPQQCVFEVFLGALNNTNPPNVGLLAPVKILTGLKTDPPTPDDIEFDINIPNNPILRTNNAVAFPVAFPVVDVWKDVVWNTN